MELTLVTYLLFTLPGFGLVWTFRHYTKATKIGDFEYAAWSFLWGTLMYVLLIYLSDNNSETTLDLSQPFQILGYSIGFGFATIVLLSFPAGIIVAMISQTGIFSWTDKMIFKLINSISNFLVGK